MDLIQTEKCSIIYGLHNGEENQELFRCPRELDDIDLKRYINENRVLLKLEDDNTEDLHDVEGKTLIGYWRMYYRGGWAGRWILENKYTPDTLDCIGVNMIIDWIVKKFPKGCNWTMKDYLGKSDFTSHADGNRYLIRPYMSDYYKIMFDTTYGNGDYPVRIYVYKDNDEMEEFNK